MFPKVLHYSFKVCVFIMPTCWCVLLLGANSFGGRPLSPLTSLSSSSHFLLLRCHLDADLYRLQHLPQLPPLHMVMKALQRRTPSSSSPVGHLVVAAIGQKRRLALLLLVLDEEEDVAQREGHLTLAAGQQVVVGVEAGRQDMGQTRLQRMGR